MSGFAYSLKASTALTPPQMDYYIPEEESAGKAGQWLGVIAAIFIPYAAPAIFGAIAGSGVLGAGLAAAAQAGTIGTLTSTLGSAVVGGLMNAGVAYASGARGSQVWQAAGMGALQGGGGALSRASAAARGATAAGGAGGTGAGLVPAGVTPGSVTSPTSVPGFGGGMIELNTSLPTLGAPVSNTSSGNILGAIAQRTGAGGMDLNRIGAAIINAAVNGTQMAGMDDLVAQQRAELEALARTNQAAYQARIGEAQKIIAQADAMDPAWRGRMAMADVQGAESRAADQAMRNIAVRQGGSLDAGQRKSYERSAKLHTARSSSLAYNQAFKQAEVSQAQLRATGAGLLGPDQFGLQLAGAQTDLEAARLREQGNRLADTADAFVSAFRTPFKPATSPDPTANYEDEDQNNFGTVSGFGGGN